MAANAAIEKSTNQRSGFRIDSGAKGFLGSITRVVMAFQHPRSERFRKYSRNIA
jgi:hypothetical protein